MNACSVIDAPSDLGLKPTGLAGLPDALRAAGLLAGLPDVRYGGRVPVPRYVTGRDAGEGIANLEGIRSFTRTLADRVAQVLDEGRFPLVLGGDCSILLGPALALRQRGRFGLLFMDGHADFYSPESEPNGEAASMDLAMVTGQGPSSLTDSEGRKPLVRQEDVALFGFRDADSALVHGCPDVRETEILTLDLDSVRDMGVVTAARRALTRVEVDGLDGFWIHLDADVLHDHVMPAVDYRMPDGLWPEELSEALSVALSSPRVVGMDITIYNPALDDADRSAASTLVNVVTVAFGAAQTARPGGSGATA